MNNPLVSVVVPTYNRHAMLRKALRSLTVQETNDKFSYEIVVVDNGSTEPTRAVVAEIAAGSRVALSYVREEAGGYPEALNRGVREARGMWVALFDDDQLAEANWLKELLSAASLTKAKLVGGSIRPRPTTVTAAISTGATCGRIWIRSGKYAGASCWSIPRGSITTWKKCSRNSISAISLD